MRTKRIKLLYTFASLALAMSFFIVGVYAAVNRTVTVSGSLSFTSSMVLVRYTVEASQPYDGSNPTAYQTGQYTKTDSFTESSQGQKNVDFDSNFLDIADGARKIALRVTLQPPVGVTNFYRNFKVVVTNNTTSIPSWLTIKVGSTASGSTTHATGISSEYNATTAQTSIVVFVVFEAPAQPHNITLVQPTKPFNLTFDLQLT